MYFLIRTVLNTRLKIPFRKDLFKKFYSKEQSPAEVLNKKLLENKTNNILVYTCSSKGSVRVNLLGIVGGCILLGASYNSWYLFSSVKFKTRNIDNENSDFFKTILKIIGSDYFKIALCFSTALIGLSTIFITMFFTARSVNKLYLLKGANQLGIITDGIFGKEMKYVLSLNETNFSSTRKMRTSQVTFRNKKHYFYFLLNNIDGEYHEKELFDHVICAKRE